MSHPRIKMSHLREEPTPRNIFTDYDWVHRHENELREQYGECWVVVFQEEVLGTGTDYHTALADAASRLPLDGPIITPIVNSIHKPHPFMRAYPVATTSSNGR
jgi:hypothetical protein